MPRPLLYISGPYSADPVLHTRITVLTATAIYQHTEFVPVIPHLSHFWHLITPLPYDNWLEIDLSILARCHAITRLPGESPGADRELQYAAQLELPVISIEDMGQPVTVAYRQAAGILV
jgi:hypothetical protein